MHQRWAWRDRALGVAGRNGYVHYAHQQGHIWEMLSQHMELALMELAE